jgi:hypothetical protein
LAQAHLRKSARAPPQFLRRPQITKPDPHLGPIQPPNPLQAHPQKSAHAPWSFPPGRRDPPRFPQPNSTFGPTRPASPPPPRSLTGGPPLSSLTPRRAGVGLWESRPRTPAPPPRRGPHTNGCARPFISGRHHPGADSQNPSRCRPAFRRRRTTQFRRRLGPPSQTPAWTHRRRREVHDVALHLLGFSLSPVQHRSAAAALDPSRPP